MTGAKVVADKIVCGWCGANLCTHGALKFVSEKVVTEDGKRFIDTCYQCVECESKIVSREEILDTRCVN